MRTAVEQAVPANPPSGAALALLDALPEPSFVLTEGGMVLAANRAAQRLLGTDPASHDLRGYVCSPVETFDHWLRRCSRTTSPHPGSLSLRTSEGARKLRAHCCRLADDSGGVRLVLRCWSPHGDEFSVLARKVRELNDQLRARLREKAVLQESLRQNETLTHELRHRVKNNIQMMMSLLASSAARSKDPAAREVLIAANRRLIAMGKTHDLIEVTRERGSIPAGSFLEKLTSAIGETLDGAEIRLKVAKASLSHDIAHCFALVVNELVTNAAKHGLRGSAGVVHVSLDREGQDLTLVVRDEGPGFRENSVSGGRSGLDLVRGLCRQMSGSVEFVNDDGAKCIVRIPATGGSET